MIVESPERHFWTLIEPIHALTYFAPEAHQAFEDAGLRGFWRGYFAGRAAPLGAVGAEVVTALFYGFHPDFVERAVPDIWKRCSPEHALSARLAGVDAAWQTHLALVGRQQLRRAGLILHSAIESVDGDRVRPMFAANLALDWPDAAHLAVWHATTVLREHRGDGHVAALQAHELGPCEAHVLRLAHRGDPLDSVKPHRGWSDDDWIAAVGRLVERQLIDETGLISGVGDDVVNDVEAMTDRLARRPVEAIQPELAELSSLLAPVVTALADTVIPYPNPMGVERFEP